MLTLLACRRARCAGKRRRHQRGAERPRSTALTVRRGPQWRKPTRHRKNQGRRDHLGGLDWSQKSV